MKKLYRRWRLVRILKRWQKRKGFEHMTLPQVYHHLLKAYKRMANAFKAAGLTMQELSRGYRALYLAAKKAEEQTKKFTEQIVGAEQNESN